MIAQASCSCRSAIAWRASLADVSTVGCADPGSDMREPYFSLTRRKLPSRTLTRPKLADPPESF